MRAQPFIPDLGRLARIVVLGERCLLMLPVEAGLRTIRLGMMQVDESYDGKIIRANGPSPVASDHSVVGE